MSVDDLKMIPVVLLAGWFLLRVLGGIAHRVPKETDEDWRDRQW